MRVALAQIAPVLLDRAGTNERILAALDEAAADKAALVCFGETLLPGYPLWLSRTDGARFDDALLKELHARYLEQAVCVEDGDLAPIQAAATTHCACAGTRSTRARSRSDRTASCAPATASWCRPTRSASAGAQATATGW